MCRAWDFCQDNGNLLARKVNTTNSIIVRWAMFRFRRGWLFFQVFSRCDKSSAKCPGPRLNETNRPPAVILGGRAVFSVVFADDLSMIDCDISHWVNVQRITEVIGMITNHFCCVK